jgi:hydroxymethylbilane synthase
VSRALGGSCVIPLGAFAEVQDARVRIRGFVAAPDGSRIARAQLQGARLDEPPELIGERLAQDLVADGAREILAALPG